MELGFPFCQGITNLFWPFRVLWNIYASVFALLQAYTPVLQRHEDRETEILPHLWSDALQRNLLVWWTTVFFSLLPFDWHKIKMYNQAFKPCIIFFPSKEFEIGGIFWSDCFTFKVKSKNANRETIRSSLTTGWCAHGSLLHRTMTPEASFSFVILTKLNV